MRNEKIQALAKQLDEYYDSLLYEGMPMEDDVRIEQQRAAAHAELTRQVMAAALDGRSSVLRANEVSPPGLSTE
jgi:hypothetical protein